MKKVKQGVSYGRASRPDMVFRKNGQRIEDGTPEAQRIRSEDHAKYLTTKKAANIKL